MESDPIIWQIGLQLILILLNAVFACAEIAVISMNDTKLAKLANEGNTQAIKLMHITSQPARFLATIQVAITLSGFMGSAFAADNFSDILVNFFLSCGINLSLKALDTLSVIIITLILSYLTLVFGELVPKRLAMKKAEQLALSMASLISAVSTLFRPLVSLLTFSTNSILRLFGIDPNSHDEKITEEEIRMMVDAGSEKGAIDIKEKLFIQNVFEFNDISLENIETHRTNVVFLQIDASIEDWEQTINETRHKLYPICDGNIDNIAGILNIKDYFTLKEKTFDNIMKFAVKPPYFVLENIRADVLFRNMQTTHNHFAIVLDEYGGMTGLITMNDLLEQLVGDLNDGDEPEDSNDEIQYLSDNTWKIRGSTDLSKISKELDVVFEKNRYDTLNGLIFDAYGCIPDDGKQIELEIGKLHIKVIEIKEHRVENALITRT